MRLPVQSAAVSRGAFGVPAPRPSERFGIRPMEPCFSPKVTCFCNATQSACCAAGQACSVQNNVCSCSGF